MTHSAAMWPPVSLTVGDGEYRMETEQQLQPWPSLLSPAPRRRVGSLADEEDGQGDRFVLTPLTSDITSTARHPPHRDIQDLLDRITLNSQAKGSVSKPFCKAS